MELLLGVVAIAEKPLLSYPTWPLVRWLTAAGIVLLLLALIIGLVVLYGLGEPARAGAGP